VAIIPCQPRLSLKNVPINEPITIPPGNQTWNLLSICVFLSGYISAIRGLQAASTEPLASPMKSVETSRSAYGPSTSPAKMVRVSPSRWKMKAAYIISLGPTALYSRPPTIIAIGKPRKAMELTQPI